MFRLLIALLLISSPAFAVEIPLTCDIEIEFNSEGSGIDPAVYSNIMDRINATPAITETYIGNLGHEGERTLCLTVKPDELGVVYEDLKSYIPEESLRTWTRIKSRTGAEFKTAPVKGLSRYDWQN